MLRLDPGAVGKEDVPADQEPDGVSEDSDAQIGDAVIADIPAESPEVDNGEPPAPEGRDAVVEDGEEAENSIQTNDSALEDPTAKVSDDTSGTGDGSASGGVDDGAAASSSSEVSEVREEPVDDPVAHGINAQDEDVGNEQDSDLPPQPLSDSGEHAAVLPPPAPATATVVISGSMVPEGDENSDDSDSDDEADANDGDDLSSSPPAPVISASDSVDEDDEDELEVDPAVAGTIEPASRASIKVSVDQVASKVDISGSEDVSIGFGDEIRVAAVVVESELDSSAIASVNGKTTGGFGVDPAAKGKRQERTSKEEDVAFGISYQSTKKRLSSSPVEHDDNYSLPKAPAFPDEKEFEREVQIDSEGSFSTMNGHLRHGSGQENGDRRADADDDDEFRFDEASDAVASAEVISFSAEELEARRASLAARKAQEEAKMLEELKRATDDERKMIERAEAAEQQHQQQVSNTPSTEADTSLSLGELHGMYKRGLGDQSVHFLDEVTEGTDKSSAGAAAGPPGATNEGTKAKKTPPERLSVMGRLLSKPRALTDVIVEAENEDDGDDREEGEDDGGSQEHDDMSYDDATRLGVRSDQQTLLGCDDDEYDDEDVGGGEWKEIQLTEKMTTASANNATTDEGVPSSPSPLKPPQQQWRISYTESAGYFAEALEFLDQRDRIVPEEFPARTSCFSCLSRPRLTFPGAIDERDRVFCIAATSFDPSNDVFCRMVQTIYARLVPSPSAPPLIGGHWEQIGFQGSDPATDLRGVGVLALLQMLYLVESHGELARRLHSLSQHSTRHFPFACALINTTLQCLVALRSGALYPECNKHASIVAGINMVRAACWSSCARPSLTSLLVALAAVRRAVL